MPPSSGAGLLSVRTVGNLFSYEITDDGRAALKRSDGAAKQPKAATAGRAESGDGFSQYETTDMSLSTVAPSQDLFPPKKSRRWVEISDGFPIRTR
jgi:hypothetical protein